MTSLEEIWRRTRERKIVQWALGYLAAAWLTLQLIDLLGATYHWPSALLRAVPLLLAIGFLATLVLAWYHGERGQQRMTASEVVLLGLLALLAAGAVGWARRGAAPQPATIAAADVDPRSVAVLPFASGDTANAFLSEGLTDELINALSRVEDVHVLARTSSFIYKDTTADARAVGKKLGVAHVVDGTVWKSNDRLRVSIQLISVGNGYQVWSEAYNRELTDVFAVQEEIARKVAEALRARLSSAEKAALAIRPTENLEAYELYLRGRYFWNQRTPVSLRKAAEYFERASRYDSTYALPYAGLADVYNLLGVFGIESGRTAFKAAELAAAKAQRLNPAIAEPYAALAFALTHQWRFEQVEQNYLRAIEVDPRYASAHQWYGQYLAVIGRWPEGGQHLQRAHQLEPLSLAILTDMARNAYLTGRYEDALRLLGEGLEVDPHYARAHGILGLVAAQQRDYEGAIREFTKAIELAGGWYPNRWGQAGLARAYALKGDSAGARKILRELQQSKKYVSPEALTLILSALGDQAQALSALESAVADNSVNIIHMLYDPAFAQVRAQPGFARIRNRIPASGG